MTLEHVSFERLSDYIDGSVGASEATAIERHVAICAGCGDQVARLRSLLERATALPSSVEPPPEVWLGVRDRLQSRRPVVAKPARPWILEWGLRAAATIVLVAASSVLAVIMLRSRPSEPRSTVPNVVAIPVESQTVVRTVEQSYGSVLEELTSTLRAQRASLAPETVATLERTLRIIDDAIAEARAALAADPGNRALLDILSANYEQKVELLRRASELTART